MKCKRNILFTIILFIVVLFCFESNIHLHSNIPLYNVENTTDSSTGEHKCSSSSELCDDYKINFNTDFSFLEGIKIEIPQINVLISNYILSFWQPPKIS